MGGDHRLDEQAAGAGGGAGRGGMGGEIGHDRWAGAVAQRVGVIAGGGRPDRVLRADAVGARPLRDRPVARRLLRLQVLDRLRCGVHLRGSALPVPMAKASALRLSLAVVASAATLLVLPMSVPTRRTGTPPLPELSSPHEASSRLARGRRSTPRVGLLACGSMPNTAAFPGDQPPGGTMAADSPLTVARQRRILTGFPSPGALFSCGRRVCAGSRAGSSRGRWVHLRPCARARGRSPSSPSTRRHCRIWAAARTAA